MTEIEWLTSQDPVAMPRLASGLVSLCCGCVWCRNADGTVSLANGQTCCPRCDNDHPSEGYRRIASHRKLRLFAVACCRQKWFLLIDRRHRHAVVTAERFADGEINEAERYSEHLKVQGICHGASNVLVSDDVLAKMPPDSPNPWSRIFEDCGTPAAQTNFLRDIVGNPFRPVEYDRCLGIRNQGAVIIIAHGVYEHRLPDGTLDPVRLAILADALEEAGCTDDRILRHLRSQHDPDPDPAPWEHRERANSDATSMATEFEARLRQQPIAHFRGCWALDLILGKE